MVHISFQKSDVTKNCLSNKKMFANSQASVSNLQMLFLIIRTIHFNSESRKVKTIFELEYLFLRFVTAMEDGAVDTTFLSASSVFDLKSMYYIPQIKS